MELFLGVIALAALSLFLAHKFCVSSSAAPFAASCISICWFMLMGCLNLLVVGGIVWFAGCAAALVFVIFKTKKEILKLLSPGFVFFVCGSAFFIILFLITKPMLIQWDEFTFWGTAAKATVQNNQLYTIANSNLIARSYPPGLVSFHYMMQFFGPWAEHKFIAAVAILQLSALMVPAAIWKKSKSAAVLMPCLMFFLPMFFEMQGEVSFSYLSCMVDAPMAAMFGAILCVYFSFEEKTSKAMLLLLPMFAALTSMKDMGLAFALIALFIIVLDLFFCGRKDIKFLKLRRMPAILTFFGVGAVAVLGSYASWALYLKIAPMPENVDRFNLGNTQQSLGMGNMLINGFKALFGISPDAHFNETAKRMVNAFFAADRKMFLLGGSVALLCIIIGILLVAWVLSASKRQRRRVLVFAGGMAVCFVAFYIFNIFTYTYILKGHESEILKDYHRYIYPFWFAWLMGSITLLAKAAANAKTLRLRAQAARICFAGLCVLLIGCVVIFGNRGANFLNLSPSFYGKRLSVQETVQNAEENGMAQKDVVYIISQGDDASRFYMLAYEMDAKTEFLYVGKEKNAKGELVYLGNTASSLIKPNEINEDYEFGAECTPKELMAYLKQQGCTHVLIDLPDEYILETFGRMFSDKLDGWKIDPDNGIEKGHNYYKIQWRGKTCKFVRQGGTS